MSTNSAMAGHGVQLGVHGGQVADGRLLDRLSVSVTTAARVVFGRLISANLLCAQESSPSALVTRL
jgi:hypothetical protein